MNGQVATANRLADGAVVYLDPDGGWSQNIGDARVAADDAGIAALERDAAAGESANHVVGAYLIAVERTDGLVRPMRLREAIRAAGPTVDGAAGAPEINAQGNGSGVSLR